MNEWVAEGVASDPYDSSLHTFPKFDDNCNIYPIVSLNCNKYSVGSPEHSSCQDYAIEDRKKIQLTKDLSLSENKLE